MVDPGVRSVVVVASAFPHVRDAGIDMVLFRRVRALAARAAVVVLSPRPWAPRAIAAWHPRWASYAQLPTTLEADGVAVRYPRYLQVPKSGTAAGFAMAAGIAPAVARLRRAGRCDVLFALTIVPDGLAAVLVGRSLGIPVACLGRGTDVHGLASAVARRLAAWTVTRAGAVGVVAHDLADKLAAIAPRRRATVLPSGIELGAFAPADSRIAREALGLPPDDETIVFVGRLAAGKGLAGLLEAFARLARDRPRARLVLVGTGPLAAELWTAARARGLDDRVTFAGEMPHARVPRWLQAADVVVLPSEAEGLPAAVFEGLACGRPVVATAVGDVPRLVDDDAGRLVPVGDPAALAAALADVLARPWSPDALRARVAGMTWERAADETTRFLAEAVAA